MNGTQFAIFAYLLGIGLLWGYAISLFLSQRALRKRDNSDGGAG